MRNTDKPRANPFVVLREEFDDWAILFNPDTGRGFGLSPTGVLVWKLLDGERTIDALLEQVREHAESVPDEAGDDLEAFVHALLAERLTGSISTRRIAEHGTRRRTLPRFGFRAVSKRKASRTNPPG